MTLVLCRRRILSCVWEKRRISSITHYVADRSSIWSRLLAHHRRPAGLIVNRTKRVNRSSLERAFTGWSKEARLLMKAPVQWRAWPLYHRPPISTFSLGRVALVGDAAHPMVPFLAQGAAQAIEDAGALGRILAQATGYPGGSLDVLAQSRSQDGSSSTRGPQTWPHLSYERSVGVRPGCDDAAAGDAWPDRAVRLALWRVMPEQNPPLFYERQARLGPRLSDECEGSGSGTAWCVHAADAGKKVWARSPRRSRLRP